MLTHELRHLKVNFSIEQIACVAKSFGSKRSSFELLMHLICVIAFKWIFLRAHYFDWCLANRQRQQINMRITFQNTLINLKLIDVRYVHFVGQIPHSLCRSEMSKCHFQFQLFVAVT